MSKKVKALLIAILVFIIIFLVPWPQQKVICIHFSYQQEAQRKFDSDRVKYKGLDGDNDGIPCEALPQYKHGERN